MTSPDSRQQLREEVQSLKEASPCTDCKKFYPFYVMQFDHLGDKVMNVGKMISSRKSRQLVLDEIAKCELVCANCHAARSYNRQFSTT